MCLLKQWWTDHPLHGLPLQDTSLPLSHPTLPFKKARPLFIHLSLLSTVLHTPWHIIANTNLLNWTKEKWNAVPLTKLYFLLLSPTPRLDFSFLWVTGFHDLLPFISFSFAKLLAELLAKGSASLWKHTHTSNSWVLRELLKAFLPKEGLQILKARKCFTLCPNRNGFHWKILKWGVLQKGFRCQHFWVLYFTLRSHVQRSAPSWVSQIIPTSHIWSLSSEVLLPLKQTKQNKQNSAPAFQLHQSKLSDCVSHTTNF